jgi:predicted lipase
MSAINQPRVLYQPIQDFYDKQNAKVLCEISASAYDTAGLVPAGFKIAAKVPCSKMDLLAVILEAEEDIVAVFRGTIADLRNYILDADCRKEPFSRFTTANIHNGFLIAYKAMQEDLLAVMNSLPVGKRLWFTGHSLGGALAVVAGAFRLGYSAQSLSIYTFGQPRVGDYRFAMWMTERMGGRWFRVVNSVDLVPRVPHFEWDVKWRMDYPCGIFWHGGIEAFYGADKVVELYPSYRRKAASDFREMLGELRHMQIAALNDHHVAKYEGLFT